MGNITNEVLIKQVAEETGLTYSRTKEVIKSVFDNIAYELSRGNNVKISDFGTFELKLRKPRTGRNPHTGKAVPIPERVVPNFRASERLKNVTVKEIINKE